MGGSFGALVFIPVHSVIGTANTFGLTGIGALIGALGFIIGNAKVAHQAAGTGCGRRLTGLATWV